MKRLDFPNRITIELTNRCNVSCTFCNRQKINMELGDMDEQLYYKIIDEAARHLPMKAVLFFRGESLLIPKLISFIEYAKKRGIGPIQLASNALLLDKELSEKLILSGIDFISFSLDTLDIEVYNKSRLTGDLAKSIKNVQYLGLRCREEAKKGKKVPTLQVSTIDLDIYKEKQEDFIRFWQQYVDIVRVYYEHDEKGHLINKEIGTSLCNGIDRKPCRKLFTDMIVYWNGEIAKCNYDWNNEDKIGDLKVSSIEEIWNSEKYEQIRSMHIHNNFSGNLLCNECEHWKIDYTPEGFLGKVYKNYE